MNYLCGFTIEYMKKQTKFSISGEVYVLFGRTIKQAKIRKKIKQKAVFFNKTTYFNLTVTSCRMNRAKLGTLSSSITVTYPKNNNNLVFLSRDISPLIYWPKNEDALRYYPNCFKEYRDIIDIIDWIESTLKTNNCQGSDKKLSNKKIKKYMENFLIYNTCWNYIIHLGVL